jgi:hypothetical protein
MLRRCLFVVLLIALTGPVVFRPPAARTSSESHTANQTLRVMTYNIHVGVGMDKKLDLPRIAGVINVQHPDLVGLQEVDRGVARYSKKKLLITLARAVFSVLKTRSCLNLFRCLEWPLAAHARADEVNS